MQIKPAHQRYEDVFATNHETPIVDQQPDEYSREPIGFKLIALI